MKKSIYTLIFLLFITSGCRVGPKYVPPTAPVPAAWKAPEPEPSPKAEFVDYWWEIFEDDTLNCLEEQAVKNNPNLFVALDKVIQARANALATKANLYPQINLNPSYLNTGQLFKIFLPNTGTPNPILGQIPDVFRIHQLQYSLLLNANYELDLWGKLKDQYDASLFTADAQLEAYHTAILTLTTDLAAYYFQLRTADAQILLLEETIKLRQKGYDLATQRYQKGLTGYVEVAQSSLLLTNAQADYYDAVAQRRIYENQIATLIGVPASEFQLCANPLQGPPPNPPAGIPSEVLKQRPDIAEAERMVAAQNAQVGAAYASFYPSIQLTGAVGYFSPELKEFLKWPSRFWQWGVDAAQTVFDGGQKVANLELALAQFQEANDSYRQLVLKAFQEVEDSLSDIQMKELQTNRLKLSVDASQKATQLAISRYRRGLTNYLEVVDTQKSQLEAEINHLRTLGERYTATIQFIKAMGGNWYGTKDLFQAPTEEPGGC